MRYSNWTPHEKQMLDVGVGDMSGDPKRLGYAVERLRDLFGVVPKRVVDSLTSRAQKILKDWFRL